jgi:hypothetical protein
MSLPVLLLLALLLLALWLLVRLRRGKPAQSPPPNAESTSATSRYHAVSIKITGSACRAARELTGQRFLSTEAPALPLPDCTMAECHCRFVHHKDRRTGKDRRSPFSPAGFGGGTGSFEADKREGKDRRTSDGEDSF